MGFFSEFVGGLSVGYSELVATLPAEYSSMINVFIFAILIALYSVFTWKFYRYISKKDLINLNLQKYNTTEHPFTNKFLAAVLYMVEYIIILPFLIFFWFAILALIILVLSEELAAIQVIILSAAIVAAVRMLSYYEQDLSKDLAKIFPFTILTIFVINPGFFSLGRVLLNLQQIPSFIKSIFLFLVLIIIVELIFRVVDLILNFFKSDHEETVVVTKQKVEDVE